MQPGCEVLATLTGSSSPKLLRFSELYDLRDSLQSIMLMWDSNSYYVDSVSKVFIINGGRRTRFDGLGDCRILYRKRNRVDVSVNGDGSSEKSVHHLVGIREVSSDKVVFVKVSDDGASWEWGTTL